jgi:hypothetical protein
MSKIAIKFAMFFVAGLVLNGCEAQQRVSDLNFDSAHTLAYDGVIDRGKIFSTTDADAVISAQIKEQLMYTIGQLNGRGGGVDMHKLETMILEKAERAEGGFDVTYAAKLLIAWPREAAAPENYEFVLPARGDYQGQSDFFAAYGADEDLGQKCLAWGAHGVNGIFWYYYRPEKSGCPLKDPTLDDRTVVVRTVAHLSVSGQNTENKAPEYSKVWEDNKLIVTAIFGKNEEGETSDNDAGIAAFRQLYTDLIGTYGTPTSSSLLPGQNPDAVNIDVRLEFATDRGALEVHLYLVDGIRSVDAEFRAKYNERTKTSDFISYSGHSGLGANIRALARMGSFQKDKYQVFLINGCDTFAYVDGALTKAHHNVNPDFAATKFVDIITNAMPSYFHSNSRSNMQLIDGLLKQESTYRVILAGFDSSQRAIVTGEEDNRWPLPFLE